jgi:Gpi18-like mannosyltransferase
MSHLQLSALRHWKDDPAGRHLLVLLAVALVIRFILAPYPDLFNDMQNFVTWGLVAEHQFWHLYSATSRFSVPDNYPPLAGELFVVQVALYVGFFRIIGSHAPLTLTSSPTLSVWMKLPMIAADLGAIVVLYMLARRRMSERWALFLAATYAFSPPILVGGVIWGQIDTLFVFPLLLALYFTLERRGLAAGVCFGLAIMLKPLPLVFAPLFPIYLYRWEGWRQALRFVGGAAGISLILSLPYLMPPRPEVLAFLQNVQKLETNGHASDGGFNLWWLVAPNTGYAAPLWGPLSASAIGWGLFAGALALAIAGIWRSGSEEILLGAAALLAIAFFDVTTLQHQRYLYPALALLLAASFWARGYLSLYLLTSVTFFLNLVITVGMYDKEIPYLTGWYYFINAHLDTVLVITNGVALIQLGILIWAVMLFMRRSYGTGGTEVAAKETGITPAHQGSIAAL